jgi:hypothetical protein
MVALTAHHLRAIRQAGEDQIAGLPYSSSLDMSHSRRPFLLRLVHIDDAGLHPVAFSSFSYWKATAGSAVHAKPSKRCAVRVISVGLPLNGAFSISTRSRCGTLTFQSPLSSASA